MTVLRPLVALTVAALATACASPDSMKTAPASSYQSSMDQPASMAAMDPRMKAMQDMHEKMMNARTPEERQALMADHMKAMQDGMAMMKEMQGMAGMRGMTMAERKASMSGSMMGKHHQMMEDQMAMMQMMMDMMAERMPPAPR